MGSLIVLAFFLFFCGWCAGFRAGVKFVEQSKNRSYL